LKELKKLLDESRVELVKILIGIDDENLFI
jgi:hypothetical protein